VLLQRVHSPTESLPLSIHQSSPITGRERIVSLDVLRGVAVLGILLMNIVAFSMVTSAYELPTIYNDMEGADWWTWLTLHYLADTKFMSIFSILFGAGVCIFMERAQAKAHKAWLLQTSRMGWLLLIGLIHAYGIWYGDILVTYAICGMAIALVRKWKPATLFWLGMVLMFLIPIGFFLLMHWTVQYWSEEVVTTMQNADVLTSTAVQAEIAAYTGSWLDQLGHRIPTALTIHLLVLPFYLCWHAAGLMMVGMAAYKWNILNASRSVRFYSLLVIISSCIGFPLIAIGVWFKQQHGWDPILSRFVDSNWNLVGGVFVAFAWIGIVMLICKTAVLPRMQRVLAAVGRMALTNYLLQTIICTLLFYGHGLGWFGQFERVELLLFVFSVWVFQMMFSIWWLSMFQFGPFEWLWRTLTYFKFQPMKRKGSLVS
jgi:uncharacterized protein